MKIKELIASILQSSGSSADGVSSEEEPRELVLFRRASEKEQQGDYESAVSLLQQAIQMRPDAAALHNRIGVLLAVRLHRLPEGIAAIRRALELEPESVMYKHNLQQLLEKLASEAPQ